MMQDLSFKYLTKITTHVSQGLELLLQQFVGKTNLAGLLTIFLNQVQHVEDAVWDVLDRIPYQNADGLTLDNIGALAGESRFGRSDNDYREAIVLRMALNIASGTFNDMINLLTLFGGTRISVEEYGVASVQVFTDAFGSYVEPLKQIRKIVGAGVQVNVTWLDITAGNPFRFDIGGGFSEYGAAFIKQNSTGSPLGEYLTGMVKFGGKYYAVTSANNRLVRLDTDHWTSVATDYVNGLRDMLVFGGEIYAGGENEKLYKWDGTDSWDVIGDPVAATIERLFLYGDVLYFTSGKSIYAMADPITYASHVLDVGPSVTIYSVLIVSYTIMYFGMSDGTLRTYAGSGSDTQVSPAIVADLVLDLVYFDSSIYGVCAGKLLKWNGTDAWVEISAAYNGESIRRMAVLGSYIYAGTSTGNIIKSNGTDAWELVAGSLGRVDSVIGDGVYVVSGSEQGDLYKIDTTASVNGYVGDKFVELLQ
jgi:hypothetical protein